MDSGSHSGGEHGPVSDVTAYDSTTGEIRLEADAKGFRLGRGQTVDRYVVLYELGAGGMGVVYAAYDPELDRKVALKLLHPDASARGRTRLLREAKAIAKLTHPNVVTVHDVGTYEGRVFVAMEFVDGVTFRQWVQAKPHKWRAVVEVLRAAGKGLAAAHAADLVHRDFKPDNILVEHGGRVVVLDFGLARRASTHDEIEVDERRRSAESRPALRVDELDVELTRTGALLGTPAYMAPEQHLSGPTDERTDQFSFCVVMWEALYGVRPFRGESAALTAALVLRGEIAEPPKSARVPKWLRRVLVRGLSVEPDDRYRDMRALLADLARDRTRQRRRWLVVGAVGLAAAGVGISGGMLGKPDPCAGAQERFEEVWDAGARDDVRAAFTSTEIPYAKTAWAGVEAELDAYGQAWIAMHRDACEATHVRYEQSPDMLDLRMTCLRGRLGEVAALVDEFRRADEAVVQNAVEAVSALGRLDRCEDLEALAARVRPPEDEATRQRVSALRDQLSDAKAKEFSARYDGALQIANDVALVARDVGYAPLVAEAELRVAAILERKGDFEAAERKLLEAIWAAESSHHEEVAAEAWVKLVWVTGVERFQTEQGHVWGNFAKAALDRLGRAELLDAMLIHNLGGVLYREGRLDEALESYRSALVAQKKLLGADDPAVGTTLNHIGNTLIELGRYGMARDYCERSLQLRQRTLGDEHPKVAASLNNIGELLRKQGEHDESLEYARRSLEIVGGTGGPEELVALILEHLALQNLKRWDEAMHSAERMVALHEQLDGPDHARTTSAIVALAAAQKNSGHLDDALASYDRALELDRKAGRHTAVAQAMLGRARTLAAQGEREAAKTQIAEAIVEARRADKPDANLLATLEADPLGSDSAHGN